LVGYIVSTLSDGHVAAELVETTSTFFIASSKILFELHPFTRRKITMTNLTTPTDFPAIERDAVFPVVAELTDADLSQVAGGRCSGGKVGEVPVVTG
jgi:hypothetical protein